MSQNKVLNLAEKKAKLREMLLKKQQNQSKPNNYQAITRRPDSAETVELSYAQQRLWFLDQLQGGSAEYNMPAAFAVEGRLDGHLLDQVFRRILERHQVLRTCYVEQSDSNAELQVQRVVQKILDTKDFAVLSHDLSEVAESEQQDKLQQLIEADVITPFDLSADFMLRVSYINLTGPQAEQQRGVLLFNVHHIASDGWSMNVLMQEFLALYRGCQQGQALDTVLSELPIQYADFAYWQRQGDFENMLQKQLEYWHQQLEDVPTIHGLSLDYPRPAEKSHQGANIYHSLSADVAQGLTELAKQHQLTPFMLIHGALAYTLSKHSNSSDIVIGTPVANRRQVELTPLIGFFVNTLVLRTKTDFDNLSDYLEHVKTVHLDAQSNQDVPFERLVEMLNIPRNRAYPPLFQIMLTTNTNFAVGEQAEADSLKLQGLEFSPLQADTVTAKFDLNIDIALEQDGVNLIWNYDTSLFSAEHVAQINSHLCSLLSQLSQHAVTQIGSKLSMSQLQLLSHSEQTELLQTLSSAELEFPKHQGIHQLVAEQAAQAPSSIALTQLNHHGELEQLSYLQYEQKANKLANYLIQHHEVSANQLVGLCLPRGFDMHIALLAILKAGAAYVPFDIKLSAEVVKKRAAAAQISLVISKESFSSWFDDSVIVIDLDETELQTAISSESQQLVEKAFNSQQTCYALTTSGSTGEPKLIGMPHRPLVNLLYAMQFDCSAIRGQHSIIQFASIGFDMSFTDSFLALTQGGQLHLINDEDQFDTVQLAQLMLKRQCSLINLPFAMLQALCCYSNENELYFPDLKVILSTAEQLLITPDVRLFFRRHTHVELVNHYGPSETHVCTSLVLEGDPEQWPATPTIGHAIANVHCYVLDKQRQLVAKGAIGELYVGGEGIATGYLGNKRLTDEKFVIDPFVDEVDARMYQTGDLVRFNELNQLEYIGRIDSQIKINGFRVEIGAIESALNDHPLVNQSCVLYLPDEKQLYAYIASGETELSVSELKSYLQTVLPEYMVPQFYEFLAHLPLNTNGKVDKKSLPKPDLSSLDVAYRPAETEVEESIVACWASLLNRPADQISIDANFFDLGGHSLLATSVVTHIKRQYQLSLKVKDLFDHQTVATLANYVEQQMQLEQPYVEVEMENVVPRPENAEAELSFQQQRLWLLSQLEASSSQYNMPLALNIRGQLNLTALQKTIYSIVDRHEVLRTVYRVDQQGQGLPVLIDNDFEINFVELTDKANAELALSELAKAEAMKPFDLSKDLMLRAGLIKYAEQDYVLLLTSHHIASDGWSTAILIDEISAFYHHYDKGERLELTELSAQYQDYAYWQRQYLQGETLQQQLDFWQQYLASAPAVHSLPLDHKRPPVMSHRGDVVHQRITGQLWLQIEQALSEHQVTLFMLLNAALGAFLARYGNSDEMLLGTPIANRQQQNVAPLVGFFTNTLVTRTHIDDHPDFATLLQRSKQELLAIYEHQQLPFEKLVEALDIERSPSYNALFQVMLVLQNNRQQQISLGDLTLEPFEQEWPVAKFDLNVVVNEQDDGLALVWEFATDLFESASIEHMSERFSVFLAEALRQPTTEVNKLSLVAPQMQQQLVERGAARMQNQESRSLVEVFEQVAASDPNKTAVVMADQKLSYQQLNAHADSIAGQLWQMGVRPEQPIGLMIGRSLQQVAAIIGALKTATAYVPLGLDITEERLQHIISSANIELILVDQHVPTELKQLFPQITFVDVNYLYNTEMTWSRPIAPSADSLAYIIYTSGTTGVPKGVMTTHGNVLRMFTASEDVFSFDASDVWSVFHSYTFDFSVWEFWGGLLYGGTIVMIDEVTCRSPQAFVELMEQEQVTVLNQTPSAFMQVINQTLADKNNQLWQQLRMVILDGEPLDFANLQPWFEFCDGVNPCLIHTYGITETTIHATYREVTAEDAQSRSVNLCGRPFADLSLYIVDKQLNYLPDGMVGQIVIGGAGLAKGYLGNEQLTAEKFINDHIGQQGRLYLTGDMGRIAPNGELEVLGRIDHQVKIRGFRIELGDVEAAFKDIEGISHAVAVAVDAHTLGACVALSADAEITQSQILQAAQAKLPGYMIPERLLVLQQMPLTPNGKVDRRKAKQMLAEMKIERSEHCSLNTDTERAIAEAWSELLPQQQFDRHDNFFEVGGHSLLCVQVAKAIENKLGNSVAVTDVYRFPVLKDFAQLLDTEKPQQSQSFIEHLGDTSKPTLLLIHPIGGDIFCYRELHLALSEHFSILSVQHPYFVGLVDEPKLSITELATDYCLAIESYIDEQNLAKPEIIMGWSFGGLVAQQMAWHWQSRDILMSQVVMLDSPVTEANKLDQLHEHLGLTAEASAQQVYSHLLTDEPFKQLLIDTYRLSATVDTLNSEALTRLLQLYTANTVALTYHKFNKIESPIHYFQASKAPQPLEIETLKQKVQSIGVNYSLDILEADHFEIVEQPHVAAVVERLLEKK
ncbi:non-ribosomal peptide synthetase [Pseudoalteromonas luteoviolacea]|uniref:Carrier domain-containing protein n=1 Tax=Pseudoalteromonas luteoviolacea S4054 TaxID=1129367 RepID=A0A0F6AEC0_9GAMM|nr:non-ribosomal peptide synthetase [Pseudoalteromonas luteoviolacea]AOT10640.1 hypothetical protein S4054249_22530 [Pseudoalteromonas luteoviolacea]AOT15292.1 hypothetical protein S40542_21065 [Pseudoalteromonas luteoviolacea]AOT20459.1 hypothetical protein S4054_22445 [Pseudoalteromonas luteoviolacea]KKE83739.1 hypothetical protein N479_13000 [Pseudoalteromonas luteoviolacea S4054]KZN71943.1 hypothetical protein N481_17365 [Pseudoalteromonas luteoviolacea S4047-1]